MTQLTIKDVYGEPIHIGDVVCLGIGGAFELKPCVVRGETDYSLLVWHTSKKKWNDTSFVLEDVAEYLVKSHFSRSRPIIVVNPKLLERAEAVYEVYAGLSR